MKKNMLAVSVFLSLACASGIANAKGCAKGAAVGGVTGHVAGGHGVTGAAVGCAVGHHKAKVKDKQAAAQTGTPAANAPAGKTDATVTAPNNSAGSTTQ